MKASTLLGLTAMATIALASCSYTQMGSLTMASTRNVDPGRTYALLARGVETKVKADEHALQAAIDQAVSSRPGGEYMMNVAISVNGDGKRVKLVGDVWGIPQAEGTAPAALTGAATDLKVGDKVAVRLVGSNTIVPGTIVGLQLEKALVEYQRTTSKGTETKMKEFDFDRITKVVQ